VRLWKTQEKIWQKWCMTIGGGAGGGKHGDLKDVGE
jgi:hypothetical protein